MEIRRRKTKGHTPCLSLVSVGAWTCIVMCVLHKTHTHTMQIHKECPIETVALQTSDNRASGSSPFFYRKTEPVPEGSWISELQRSILYMSPLADSCTSINSEGPSLLPASDAMHSQDTVCI